MEAVFSDTSSTTMKYIVLVSLILTVHVSGELSWKKLSRKTFTEKHNKAMLEAYSKDPEYLKIISQRNVTKGITMHDTIFTLYTRKNPNGVRIIHNDENSLTAGHFDEIKHSIFLTHGFLSGGDSGWILKMKNAQLRAMDCNFFTIDWSYCAGTLFYPDAVDCLPNVGYFTAQILLFLGSKGINYKKIHLIGHSLGAHVMAQVSQSGIKVRRITGLDPAGPMFDDEDTNARIDPSDADLVDIIHTNIDFFGFKEPTGHWDFYPNGGTLQPGCFHPVCDHSMSHVFFTTSIENEHFFPAFKCDSLEAAFDGNCKGEQFYMGILDTRGPKGIYYAFLSPRLFDQLKIGLLLSTVLFFLLIIILLIVIQIKSIELPILQTNQQKRDFSLFITCHSYYLNCLASKWCRGTVNVKEKA